VEEGFRTSSFVGTTSYSIISSSTKGNDGNLKTMFFSECGSRVRNESFFSFVNKVSNEYFNSSLRNSSP
jgi:hypothetical protein